jgi:hypothetical protein
MKKEIWEKENWESVWEWYKDISEYEEICFEERKQKDKLGTFAEYHFGTSDGWHITTRP